MKNLHVSEKQLNFIQRAIEVSSAVIQFDIDDAEFWNTYGCAKEDMKAELANLKRKVSTY